MNVRASDADRDVVREAWESIRETHLLEQGIDSLSLNPDTVLKTIPVIAAAEQRKGTP